MCGFRGSVSIAAALGVPLVLESGAAFPVRDQIIFTTAVVVVLTIVVQGLLLPGVLRWARMPADTGPEVERRFALVTSIEEALGALDATAERLGTAPEVAERLRREYEQGLALCLAEEGEDDPALVHDRHDTELRLALLAHKRATAVRLRDEQHIDDTVLRYMQGRLDLEEVRLTGRRTGVNRPGHSVCRRAAAFGSSGVETDRTPGMPTARARSCRCSVSASSSWRARASASSTSGRTPRRSPRSMRT